MGRIATALQFLLSRNTGSSFGAVRRGHYLAFVLAPVCDFAPLRGCLHDVRQLVPLTGAARLVVYLRHFIVTPVILVARFGVGSFPLSTDSGRTRFREMSRLRSTARCEARFQAASIADIRVPQLFLFASNCRSLGRGTLLRRLPVQCLQYVRPCQA